MKELNKNKIGKFIRNIRLKNNLLLREFSEKLNITQSRLSKIENGLILPDLLFIIKCSNVFNVCADEFIIYVE